ncbi:hypothetical protein B0H66DRAFT_245791 [Apodospora peruviana]|uniref:Uncharacterized protein n=1 Tax=Apodospora peruviana TaxID=516989 RepID=A0AAE0I4Y5_9PEZI|nr:hypothetical protein B0H66DRAFT_245791 [Apodospora peruviana]
MPRAAHLEFFIRLVPTLPLPVPRRRDTSPHSHPSPASRSTHPQNRFLFSCFVPFFTQRSFIVWWVNSVLSLACSCNLHTHYCSVQSLASLLCSGCWTSIGRRFLSCRCQTCILPTTSPAPPPNSAFSTLHHQHGYLYLAERSALATATDKSDPEWPASTIPSALGLAFPNCCRSFSIYAAGPDPATRHHNICLTSPILATQTVTTYNSFGSVADSFDAAPRFWLGTKHAQYHPSKDPINPPKQHKPRDTELSPILLPGSTRHGPTRRRAG